MSLETSLLVVLIFSFASFLQGMTGFGFGMAAMALLPLLIGFHDAVKLAAVLGLAVNMFTFATYRKNYDWREGKSLIAAAAVGAPCGVALAQLAPGSWMIRALGLLICVFTVHELLLSRVTKVTVPQHWAVPMGLLAGIFGAAFNIGGPPAVIYCYSRAWSKAQVVAVLQVMFLVIGLLRVAFSLGAGLIETRDTAIILAALPPTFFAITLGRKLLDRVPQSQMRVGVHLALFAMGLKYVVLGG